MIFSLKIASESEAHKQQSINNIDQNLHAYISDRQQEVANSWVNKV